MVVFVEHSVLDDPLVTNHPGFNMTRDKLMSFREGKDELTDKIDCSSYVYDQARARAIGCVCMISVEHMEREKQTGVERRRGREDDQEMGKGRRGDE